MQRHFVRRAIQHAADLLPARHLTLSMTPTTHTGRIACSLFSSSSSSSPPSASPVRSESNEKNPTNTRTATASPAKTLRAGGKQDVGKTRNDVQNVDQTGQVFGALGMSLNTPLTGTRSVIDALGPTTFTIGGVRVKGGVLIMPLFSTLWNVDTWDDLCPEAFTLVKLTLPKPDILILGCGATVLPVPQGVREMFREIGINLEAVDTKNACHTFNVLNQESRNVAAALLPLSYTYQHKPQT